ncbi:MAG: TlpA family protein disulfide reductase [Planctomycetes bacterium]|nr:TlpA family protein disulfide reductase [Planctomycetota bacterium]
MNRTWILLAALSVVFWNPGSVQAAPQIGDPPPPLQIKEWVKGKPVDLARDSGKKIHLVEFWATWCPPCKASVPLLSELQTKYKNDLVIIGVTDVDDRGNTQSAIRRFVKKQGSKMSYTVAIDDSGKTFDAYFDKAAPVGIPHAYLVDRDRKIVWQGSPLDPALMEVIPAVIDGTYDLKAAKLEAEVYRRLDALSFSLQMGQWGIVWDGLIDILKLDPANDAAFNALKDIYSLELRNTRTFRKWARSHIDAHRGNALAMERLASALLAIGDLSARTPDLVLEAAQAAHEASKGRDASVIAVYAGALYQIGDLEGAISQQRDAIALASADERKTLEGVLEYYELCKKLRETVR